MKFWPRNGTRGRQWLIVGLFAAFALGVLTWPSEVSQADPTGPPKHQHKNPELRKGPPELPTIQSHPLGEVTLPERKFKLKPVDAEGEPKNGAPGQEKKSDSEENGASRGGGATRETIAKRSIGADPGGRRHSLLPQSAPDFIAIGDCPSPTIDLKVLVITAEPTDTLTTLPAIRQALGYLGTPYTVFTATPRPSDPITDRLASLLSSGCHAFYQGVIVGNGDVAYSGECGWCTALTATEWQTLWNYEATFGIRQVSWYTYPSATYGFNPPTSSSDNPSPASLTADRRSVFSYINPNNPISINAAWTYLATPLDANTTPLLTDGQGNALAAVRVEPDSTQSFACTFDSNFFLTHTLALSHGAINWVTKGVFLGERHIYITAQPDDLFLSNDVWVPTTPCGTNPETTGVEYRVTAADLTALINWQSAKQAQAITAQLKLDLPYNGEGTVEGMYIPDDLTPFVEANQGAFKWISHTYTHPYLDDMDYTTSSSELQQNHTELHA